MSDFSFVILEIEFRECCGLLSSTRVLSLWACSMGCDVFQLQLGIAWKRISSEFWVLEGMKFQAHLNMFKSFQNCKQNCSKHVSYEACWSLSYHKYFWYRYACSVITNSSIVSFEIPVTEGLLLNYGASATVHAYLRSKHIEQLKMFKAGSLKNLRSFKYQKTS